MRASVRAVLLATPLAFLLGACGVELGESGESSGTTTGPKQLTRTYQAEDHSFQQGCRETSQHAGYTGTGYMDYGGERSMVEWNDVEAPIAGEYELTFRYANGSRRGRTALVALNDGFKDEIGVAFEPTGGWASWNTVTVVVMLEAGDNKVRVTADTSSGGPNLDKMDVTPIAIERECAGADEWETARLACPGGETISKIEFASYGTPEGACDTGHRASSCHATTSRAKVEEACLGRASCAIDATNALFGDPCGGVFKRLRVEFTCNGNGGGGEGDPDGGVGGDGGERPANLLLLAGQSNMEGNVDRRLFDALMGELEAGGGAAAVQSRLTDHLWRWYHEENDGYASYGYSPEMVALETSELIRMHDHGLVGPQLTSPQADVLCTWKDREVAPLALNCGNPFGPELVMGHYLGAHLERPSSLIKVAKGGTTLYADWLSPTAAVRRGRSVGPLYRQLEETIERVRQQPRALHPDCEPASCSWQAFVWFQGENDVFVDEARPEYAQNLRDLIADVRGAIGNPELPVIVVQVGQWASSIHSEAVVANAQATVAAEDPNTHLVKTDDLSGFYHYDPAAQLIMGERVGRALLDHYPGLGGDDSGGGDGGGSSGGDGSGGGSSAGCTTALEGEGATLACPAGQVVTEVGFASYGTPEGSCEDGHQVGACHASSSLAEVRARCLGQSHCRLEASNGIFGDPCAGVRKRLSATYTCGDSGPEDAETFANHVGGYQSAVTSGGFVPSRYDAGFSMYVAAWPLFKRYPGDISQSGLFGTWMHTKPVDDPPVEDLYSDIEGGLGWWRNTRFGTETPKFIMGGVALRFSAIANGPGAGAGTWDNPRGLYGVAQLTPWVLFPPDGLNLKQGTAGELFGYGYLPLPLTDPKTVTDGKNVVTGNQCWTLFLNTANFKGPLAFFLPYFFSKPSVDDPRLSGMFLDTRPARAGGQIAMETQHTPAAQATTADGQTYARVAPLLFPSEEDGSSVLVHNLYYYRKSALWDQVEAWFAGGTAVTGYVDPTDHFHRTFSRHQVGWSIWENPRGGGDQKNIVWDDVGGSITSDPYTNVARWNRDLVEQVRVGGRLFNVLPEYFALDRSSGKWVPVRPETVPDHSGLQNHQFPVPSGTPSPYTTPDGANTVWKSPGPVAGPFYAYPGDGSRVTYHWYRFADQPAMLKAGMTAAEREVVQRRVEKLHRSWTKDRDYLAPPAIDKALAQLDPALVVEPPPGLEVGYVPIVTRQEIAR